MSATENNLTRAILQLLTLRGWLVWRQNNAAVYNQSRRCYIFHGTPGVADILALRPGGQFWAIEVKAPKGRQSPAQAAFQAEVEKRCGIYILARSLDDVESVLRDMQ